MKIKIKEIAKPSFDELINMSRVLNFDEIVLEKYNDILVVYQDKLLIGMINYCITPSMKNKDKLVIKNLYYLNVEYIDKIIKYLLHYCGKKNYSILVVQNQKELTVNYMEILQNNNFIGDKIIYHS